jgi:hypothetical protein
MDFRTGTSASETMSEPQSTAVQRPPRMWAGHGSGATCSVCARSIQQQDIEYEVELPPGSERRSLHFHFSCYQGWIVDGALAR